MGKNGYHVRLLSGGVMMLFNDHRAFCKKCFFYSVMNPGAPLCDEGLKMQAEWKRLHDEEWEKYFKPREKKDAKR